jgi:integrase
VPGLGDRRLGGVTVADVRAFFSDLVARGVGVPTLEAVKRLLHRVFEVALEEDRVSRNPVRGVKLPQAARRHPRFLDPSEISSIAEEIPERYRALVYLLAYGGLRIGEASALRVRNLDLTRGIIMVVENAPEVRGRRFTGETKSRRVRAVHIPPFLRDMLTEHLATNGNAQDPRALVFTGPEWGAIRQNAFRARLFQPAARRAGVEPVPTVHDLRHTAASLMARAGYTMREAQEMLGHARTTMTDRYTHLWPDDLAEKVARLEELHQAAPDGQLVALERDLGDAPGA